jgi:ketosteroid isomerase-like protein
VSHENVERFRGFVEDFLAGSGETDREAWLTGLAELWDPDIEWDISEVPFPDLAPVGRGRDAMRQWWAEFLHAWESVRFAEYQLVNAGDRVVLLLDQRLRGRSTGIELTLGISAHVVTFKDGLIVHWKVCASGVDALKSVGIKE